MFQLNERPASLVARTPERLELIANFDRQALRLEVMRHFGCERVALFIDNQNRNL